MQPGVFVAAVQCFPPIAPENGRQQQPPAPKDLYNVDDAVSFECNRGFLITGAVTIKCTRAGVWSEPEPTCTGMFVA